MSRAPSGRGVDESRDLRRRNRRFYLVAAALCLFIAGVLALVASPSPDGLSRVAADTGIAANERESATADSPLAGYQVRLPAEGPTSQDPLGRVVAGVIGVALTAAAALALFGLLGRRQRQQAPNPAPGAPSASATLGA